MDHTTTALVELHAAVKGLRALVAEVASGSALQEVDSALTKSEMAIREIASGRHVRYGTPVPDLG